MQQFRQIVDEIITDKFPNYKNTIGVYNNRASFRLPFLCKEEAIVFAANFAQLAISKGMEAFIIDVRYFDDILHDSQQMRFVYGVGHRAPEMVDGEETPNLPDIWA